MIVGARKLVTILPLFSVQHPPAAARLYLSRSERSRRRFRHLGLVISHKISSDRHHHYHYGVSFLEMLKLLLLNPNFVRSLEFWTLLKIVNL